MFEHNYILLGLEPCAFPCRLTACMAELSTILLACYPACPLPCRLTAYPRCVKMAPQSA